MRTFIRLLGALLLLVLAAAAVEVVHPKGIAGLWRDLTAPKSAAPADPAKPAVTPPVAPTPELPKPPSEFWGPGATKQISWADRDYDRGDFDGSVANFTAARVLASNADERYRATQGLEKALLAWALVRNPEKVAGKPAELDAAYQKQLALVEPMRDEKRWVELARWAAGANLRERLPYVVGQALDVARPGGFVQGQIEAAAEAAGSRKEILQAAMASRGLRKGAPLATLPTSPMGDSGTKPGPAGGSSGIGGINQRGIPFGQFSGATREKLREAVGWEREGTVAYDAAGPDEPKRVENRHTAIRLLRQARDVYLAAQAEDSDSRDLDERLKHVMLMLAQLKKDEGIGK